MLVKRSTCRRLGRLALLLICSICGLGSGVGHTQTINDSLAAIAIRIPAFAGVHVDEQQNILYVHLRNGTPAMAQEVITELKIAFGDQSVGQRRIQVLPATYTISELSRWHDQL